MSYFPVNLYRLQLHAGFTFYDATRILPYLKNLGIDTLYCSPFFQAAPGSMHGYDITNPLKFNEELGGEKGFFVFQERAHSLDLGIILDVVANHMSASVHNPWWYDILEQGQASKYAAYFDIDWRSPIKNLYGKVLVPILDLPSKEAILQEKIQLTLGSQGLFITAMGQDLPLSPSSYHQIAQQLRTKADILSVLQDDKKTAELKQQVALLNQDKGKLEKLLDQQHFLLEFWQFAPHNINYRRFFDINGLVALNMDHRRCFEEFHQLAVQLFTERKIQGMRIDHPDGFYEPYSYFQALRKKCTGKQKPYIVIEKILEREEALPQKWPVEGSVGYEYLNLLNQMFLDNSQEATLTHLYHRLLGQPLDVDIMVQQEKRDYTRTYMYSEIHVMACQLLKATKNPEITQERLEEAVVELYACFPVYRTYLEKATLLLTHEEKEVFLEAFDRASLSIPHLEMIFAFLKDIFFHRRELTSEEILFVMRFQQIAPAIMAKGFEDTHLYNYNRFISLNEVGGSPHHFGESIQTFHEKIQRKHTTHPYGWITFATHDTKRSHEMRLRLNVLTELAQEWTSQVLAWTKDNKKYKHENFPDVNHEYFLYQALVGWWPVHLKNGSNEKQVLVERVKRYLIKAARESKAYTNWTHHHTAYENALLAFIDELLDENNPFYHSLGIWVKKIARAGELNSLSCLNLALMLPGSLDIYQGTELWDFSFVDPDNRRPVDYAKREELLQALPDRDPSLWITECFKNHNLEMLKLYLLKTGLHFRKTHPHMLIEAEYIPLRCEGSKKNHLIAYLRKSAQGAYTLTLSGRLLLHYKNKEFWADTSIRLPENWKDTTLTNLYTQNTAYITRTTQVQELLVTAPFGLFVTSSC